MGAGRSAPDGRSSRRPAGWFPAVVGPREYPAARRLDPLFPAVAKETYIPPHV